jgi:glycosyltransferase involved in cell wall biosynthesis
VTTDAAGHTRRVFYLGSRPAEETTGGATYMNEVIRGLERRCPLVVWDPERELKSFRGGVTGLDPLSLGRQAISNVWAIRKLRAAERGDLVITNSYLRHRFLFFALCARWVRGCRLIVFVNAMYHYSRGGKWLNRLDALVTGVFLGQAVLVIANSDATRQEVAALGVDADRIEVIRPRLTMPLPPPDGRAGGRRDGFDILFVGYCEPFKEPQVLVKALGRLRAVPFRLHIVGDVSGDPAFVRALRGLIRELGIEDRVRFHGRVGRDDLGAWFQRADLFVSPSRGEGYGRALAEAMYFGVPVIGADRGASRDLIEHGVNGLLFRAGSDESLAEHIRRLYAAVDLRRELGRSAAETIRATANYDDDIGEQFHAVLQRRGLSP